MQFPTCSPEFNITSIVNPSLGFTLAQDFEGCQEESTRGGCSAACWGKRIALLPRCDTGLAALLDQVRTDVEASLGWISIFTFYASHHFTQNEASSFLGKKDHSGPICDYLVQN